MHAMRILITLILIAFSTSPLAQAPTLVVPFGPGGGVDNIARSLAIELQNLYGKVYIVDNRPGAFGLIGADLVAHSAPNGSRLLVTRGLSETVADENYNRIMSKLVPVATIAGKSRVNDKVTYEWVGVFAPQGTPANTVADLERAIIAALNSPGFRQKASEMRLSPGYGFSPTPGDSANLAGLVAQSAGGSGGTVTGSSRASSASGSYSLGGTVGGIEIIALAPPPGARSRNECMKVEWITSPASPSQAADGRITGSDFFSDRHYVNQRQLVAYSTCDENLTFVAGACSENTLLSSGEHVGTSFETEFINRGAKPNLKILIASEYSTKPGRGDDWRTAPKKVFVGAWSISDLRNSSGFTEAGASHQRKVQALLANMRIVLGRSPGQNVGGMSWPPRSRPLAKSCVSFTPEQVWITTQ